MSLEEKWQKAAKETRIIRSRLQRLSNTEATTLSYIFLAPSLVNTGDTVVRTGKIIVDKPAIILPKNLPQFFGFDFQDELGVNDDSVRSFLIIRGIQYPSLKYQNEISTIDVFEGNVDSAIAHFGNDLERKEDIETALLVGNTEAWQLSLLIYVSVLIQRSLPKDLDNLFDQFKDF
ncbi:hypothetical protein [Candidatus Uabimicrobium amorphum]|uniref:Uncharacterized protein n=1 Tax=Uabimicrobium amorphum TaxID=2596890 RepID=A0A5S9F7E5_UABAM|nr:hypothetical protein [Candidatus Uabimicrobium amorphum]BBM87639.1 hypothetical protein UABAM_06051 [Candidatus Uabimicrobium amorphum]